MDANQSGGVDYFEFISGLKESWGVVFSSAVTSQLFRKYDRYLFFFFSISPYFLFSFSISSAVTSQLFRKYDRSLKTF